MTDFQALCAELLDWAERTSSHYVVPPDVILRARAALPQPEPQVPTGEELLAAQDQAVASFPPIHPDAEPLSAVEYARELEIRKGRAVLARWGRPAVEPVPVSERLPELGVKVLAHYFNSHGKSRTVCARWIPPKFERGDSETDDFLEYDEDDDASYWPEGWYEVIENWDDYGSIMINEGQVTHWQPLPHWALPTPNQEAGQ